MIAAQTHNEGQRGRGRSLKKKFLHSAGFGNDAQIPCLRSLMMLKAVQVQC